MKPIATIEISESAVKNNIQFIQKLIGRNVILSSVVKGNAYGHGIETYCPLAFKHGIKHFSVSDESEAFQVHQALQNEDFDLMIMGMIANESLVWAIENQISFYIFELDRLHACINVAKKLNKKAKIHIEIETGMNRTGFKISELQKVYALIKENQAYVQVEGLCTHLAGAESIANYKRISDQQRVFKNILKPIQFTDEFNPKIHMASSAATIRYPKTRYDLVRVGILQYGFFPTQEIYVHYSATKQQKENPLKRLITWKTKVMDVRDVEAGEFIGYGTSFLTNDKTKIALLPLGYASGYSRSLSNLGHVLIKGNFYNIVGTINMNMIAIDITQDPSIEKGDEVVLIGKQGEKEISVSSFSDYSQLINYELLTRLPSNIPRIIVP